MGDDLEQWRAPESDAGTSPDAPPPPDLPPPPPPDQPEPEPHPDVPHPVEHVVETGDPLVRMAASYGVNLRDVIAANPQIHDPDRIYAGQVVHIPHYPPPPPLA
jgi:hypothetical protein